MTVQNFYPDERLNLFAIPHGGKLKSFCEMLDQMGIKWEENNAKSVRCTVTELQKESLSRYAQFV